MKNILCGLLLGLPLCLSHPSVAQDKTSGSKTQSFPLAISVTNQSWAFPFSKVFRIAPIHPGLNIGSEYVYRQGKILILYQSAELGGFLNPHSGSAIYANSDIGLRGTTAFGLMADFGLGLGYFHGFHPSSIYTKNEQGIYEAVTDKGIGALSANIQATLGYKLPSSSVGLTPFLTYQWMASKAYWSLITIRPSGLLKLGIRFNLKS